MCLTKPQTFIFAAAFTLVSCTNMTGKWPNLADPLPDATERERVVESAHPSKPIVSVADTNNSLMTKSVALKLMAMVKVKTSQAKTAYLDAKNNSIKAKAEEKETAWHAAQLALTRLSQTTNKLDSIIFTEALKNEAVWAQANTLKNEHGAYVARERQSLMQLQR